ncbi:unnamed protein product, partial [marine sediment metagenome]
AITNLEKYIETMDKSSIGYTVAQVRLAKLNATLLEEKVAFIDAREVASAYAMAVDVGTASTGALAATIKDLNAALKAGMATQAAFVSAYGEAWVLPSGTPGRAEAIAIHLAGGIMPPGFEHGGIAAETGLAWVEKGEQMIPPGQRVTPPIIQIFFDGDEMEKMFSQRIIEKVKMQGG